MKKRRERGSKRKLPQRIRLLCALFCALFTLSVKTALAPSIASASPGLVSAGPTPEEELVLAQLDYQKSAGLRAYVALRKMWGLWENVNPLQVEHALLLASEDTRKSRAVRGYAAMLSAYARLRRGDLVAARRSFAAAGYVTNWLIVGPFDNEGKGGFSQIFGPEDEAGAPIVPGRAYSGKERPVRYRESPDVFRYGWVDFGYVFRPATHICAVATAFVSDPTLNPDKVATKPRKITLWVGSDGAYRVLFNGQVALEDESYRGFDVDRRAATVLLRPGQNHLSVKVCGAEESPMFALRLADQTGAPDPQLLVNTDVQSSELSRRNVDAARDVPLPPHPAALVGPLTLVDAISSNKNATAADLELAARYLVMTGGDDKTVHQARNLARRAIEAEPSVERHLLLKDLAEDRNAQADSLSAAEKLAQGKNVEVLLARAHHTRTGPSPHRAFPLYDQVLALDPDNLIALRGRVELYNAAGLRQTALKALESAYERRPHSVLLANMVASQRSQLGMSSLASEAEDRYFYQRFDDNSYLAARLELALARRDKKAASHYLSRLKDADPQSLWVYRAASRVHRAFGDDERALLDLEEAKNIAPEDVGVLQSLADLKGRLGNREEQLALLQEVLRLRPQEVEVRKYVDHIKPPEKPADEKYALEKADFLKRRHAAADGYPRRTLQDLTVSTVYKNGLSSQFRQVVFQPLTDAAAATSRQYAFQYQADRQRVQLKGARVYRADGSVDEAIESGEAAANDPSISMYTSARTYYVQFPRLEPGDVVELRYRIDDITPRNEFADYFGEVVYMQSDEPVAHAHYVLVTPKDKKLNVDAHVPGLKRTVTETDDARIYQFRAQNVPPITPEANMPPWSELLGFVHVSTYSSWDDLGRWYWGLAKEQLDLDEETRKKLRDIVKDAKTERDKVKAVYGWVTKNTRYVALEFGIYGYKPRRCVQTVNRGWGDCKDKATVIVTFLRELGINAYLVILRTGMRGDFRSELPSLAPFDHAIAYVPSLDLYLDGTAEHTGMDELPIMDQGALGLQILDGKAKLVRLPTADPARNVITRELTAVLSKNGSARIQLGYQVTGHAAPSFRANFEAESTRRDRVAQNMGAEFPGVEIDKNGISMNDLSDIETPVTIEIQGRAPLFARKEGDALSMPVTLNVRLTASYAALSTRTQDVRIQGFSSRKEKVTVKLPPGAKVDIAPPHTTHDSRFGSFSVHVEQEGQTVVVTSALSLKVDRVKPKDYADFRKFCVAADQAMGHRLVVTP
jgi:cellulose synthase operon protein C